MTLSRREEIYNKKTGSYNATTCWAHAIAVKYLVSLKWKKQKQDKKQNSAFFFPFLLVAYLILHFWTLFGTIFKLRLIWPTRLWFIFVLGAQIHTSFFFLETPQRKSKQTPSHPSLQRQYSPNIFPWYTSIQPPLAINRSLVKPDHQGL